MGTVIIIEKHGGPGFQDFILALEKPLTRSDQAPMHHAAGE
jgi:hypothetical protein